MISPVGEEMEMEGSVSVSSVVDIWVCMLNKEESECSALHLGGMIWEKLSTCHGSSRRT